jgi:formiminotetrahydrofolate cyclodeaminase
MRDQTISEFLDQLAARAPVPGGGACAALHAAQSAALVSMVARYSDGPEYADGANVIADVLKESEALRVRALRLAENDVAAFSAVSNAYGLPRSSAADRATRLAAIQAAMARAAVPQLNVIGTAHRLIELATRLLPVGNRNVITDVAAAAEAARAAAATARLNVEVNMAGVTDPAEREQVMAALATVDDLTARADHITATARKQTARSVS